MSDEQIESLRARVRELYEEVQRVSTAPRAIRLERPTKRTIQRLVPLYREIDEIEARISGLEYRGSLVKLA